MPKKIVHKTMTNVVLSMFIAMSFMQVGYTAENEVKVMVKPVKVASVLNIKRNPIQPITYPDNSFVRRKVRLLARARRLCS